MRLKTCLALGLLALAPACLFLPVFFSGKVVYGFDVISLGLPFREEIQRSLAAHQWPLWMPDILGGMPGIAACNFLFVYPTDLLCNLFGVPLGLQLGLDAALHLALAGIGMFLFLRGLHRGQGASLLGAIFFAFSGSELSKLFGGHYNFIEGIAWLPWVFWAAHKGCTKGSLFAWGLCGLFLALQILAGATQLFAYTVPAVAAFVLVLAAGGAESLSSSRTPRARTLSGLGLGGALALGMAFLIAAPQLWPTLQYLPLAARQGYTRAEFLQGSIGLSESLTWLVPGFFGWQTPTYHGAMQNCFTSEYFGLLPWALAAAALSALWRREILVRWMAGVALAAFFFAQGRWVPFYPLFHALPVFSGFRLWFRILFLLTFAVCTLAAYGWDALVGGTDRPAALRGAAVFLALAALTAALACARATGRTDAELSWLSHYIADPSKRAAYLAAISRDSARMTLLLLPALAALLLWTAKARSAGTALALALAFHAFDQKQVFDRFIHMESGIPVAHPRFTAPPPPAPGLEPWRIYDDDDSFPNDDVLLGYQNLAGLDSVPMFSAQRIREAMGARWQIWADLFNVRYVFVHSRPGSLAPGDQVAVFENRGAFPRAWLLDKTRAVGTDEEAYGLLADPGFDPRREAALPPDVVPVLGGPPPRGGVVWLGRDPEGASLDVTTDRDALLVLSEAWYPSWTARVDAATVPVLKADGGLQAVLVKAGRHRVELRFDPGLFDASLGACLAGMLALLALAGQDSKRNRLKVPGSFGDTMGPSSGAEASGAGNSATQVPHKPLSGREQVHETQ